MLARGVIQRSGGPELALELESTGYAAFGAEEDESPTPATGSPAFADPLADPFADPAGVDLSSSSRSVRRWRAP